MEDINNLLSSFKAAIFDLDGTLVESEPFHQKAWEEINIKYRMPVMTLDYMNTVGGLKSVAICEQWCQMHNLDLDCQNLAREKMELYKKKYLQQVPLLKEIADILVRAKKNGLKVAVATGSQLPETKYRLEKYKLQEFIDTIVSSDQVRHGKPAPDTYLTAAQRLQTEPHDCIVFEDTPLGLEGIKNAGMTAIRVGGGKILSAPIYP